VKTAEAVQPAGVQLSELNLAAVTDEGLKAYRLTCGAASKEELTELAGFPAIPTAEHAKFSPLTGKFLAIVEPAGVHLIDMSTSKERSFLAQAGVASLEWSPLETHLITCAKDPTTPSQSENLVVWDVETGEQVARFDWLNVAKDGAGSIAFDEEEKFMARQVAKNAIDIYDASELDSVKFQIVSKLPPLPKNQEDKRIDNSKFDGFVFCPLPPENRN